MPALLANGGAQADTFNFSYSAYSALSVTGTLTASLQSPGKYLITGITGERTVTGQGSTELSYIIAPGGAKDPAFKTTNDDILTFPNAPGYLDRNGFAYYSAGYTYQVIYNGTYFEDSGSSSSPTTYPLSSFNVSEVGAPAPIPGGGLLSFIALGLAGLIWRRKAMVAFVRARALAPSR